MICKDSVKKQIGKRFVLKFETLFEYLSPDRKFVSTTVRVDRYPVKIIAVQYLGGYYCAFFHRSGSKSRYFSIGVLGGHAAHLSMMSQK